MSWRIQNHVKVALLLIFNLQGALSNTYGAINVERLL